MSKCSFLTERNTTYTRPNLQINDLMPRHKIKSFSAIICCSVRELPAFSQKSQSESSIRGHLKEKIQPKLSSTHVESRQHSLFYFAFTRRLHSHEKRTGFMIIIIIISHLPQLLMLKLVM